MTLIATSGITTVLGPAAADLLRRYLPWSRLAMAQRRDRSTVRKQRVGVRPPEEQA